MPSRSIVLLPLALLALARPVGADAVSRMSATFHAGQTFLVWTSPPGTGWTYRVYRASWPLRYRWELAGAERVGTIGDSSWCDQRFSALRDSVTAYVVPGSGALDPTRGLFVHTPGAPQIAYYAVTCTGADGIEDRRIATGVNATPFAVAEWPEPPEPVYQRTVVQYGIPMEVRTLWTSDRDTPSFPAMSNRPSVAYDCGVVPRPGGPWQALVVHLHARNGNFLEGLWGTGMPGEWELTLDDPLRTPDRNTYWFGYHEHYDIDAPSNPTPVAGVVTDYTMRRVIYTLEWARATLPIDPTRIYAMGASMGGIGSVFLSMRRPDLIAAAMVAAPLFDFSFEDDPDPGAWFNRDGSERPFADHLFGTVQSGLLTPDGAPVFEMLNAGALARQHARDHVPPLTAFCGRHDTVVGWAEKVRFFDAMREARLGGRFFFDNRDHGSAQTAAWYPMMDYGSLYRYRLDRSFPALSNGSADANPGDGHATSGDSVGTINGFVGWDTTIVDQPSLWTTTLRLNDLRSLWGPVPAPGSATVDVTPRRLQAFEVAPGAPFRYEVRRLRDGVVAQSGFVRADAAGVLTVRGVRVERGGSVLSLVPDPDATTGVSDDRAGPASPGFGALPNPLRGACTIEVRWPAGGVADLAVFDLAGKRVLGIMTGTVTPGPRRERLDLSATPSGVYFLRAREGGRIASRRVIHIR